MVLIPDSKKCCCKGKFPKLENHSPDRCWTEFKNPNTSTGGIERAHARFKAEVSKWTETGANWRNSSRI